jgi:hypothetical protein
MRSTASITTAGQACLMRKARDDVVRVWRQIADAESLAHVVSSRRMTVTFAGSIRPGNR